VAATCAVTILPLGPAGVWNNLGAYRTGAGGALGSDWSENLRLTVNLMARERAWIFVLATIGTVLGLLTRPAAVLPIAAWATTILAMFALYPDLADKHIVYLVPPLALLAGVGLGLAPGVVSSLRVFPPTRVILPPLRSGRAGTFAALRMTWHVAAATALIAMVLYLTLDLPALYRTDRFIVHEAAEVAERRRDRAGELEMVDIFQRHSRPDDWVLSDNPGAAFEAGRKVIPSLADTSGTRVDAGSLTSSLVKQAIEAYRPAVIVTWPRRLGRLDDLTRWLPTAGYRLEHTYETGWRVYVRA
jgi:hypothetical protein